VRHTHRATTELSPYASLVMELLLFKANGHCLITVAVHGLTLGENLTVMSCH